MMTTATMKYACPYCGKTMPQGYEPSYWGCCGEAGHAVAVPLCPKCGAEDSMEQRRVRYPSYHTDADWLQCAVCGYQTDPE